MLLRLKGYKSLKTAMAKLANRINVIFSLRTQNSPSLESIQDAESSRLTSGSNQRMSQSLEVEIEVPDYT